MLTIHRIRDDADVLLEGTRGKFVEPGIPLCIEMADESGSLISFERMDGAKISSIATAIDKAFMGAKARKGTFVYNQLCGAGEPTFGICNTDGGQLSSIDGALPIEVDRQVVSGIGISSGTVGEAVVVAQVVVERVDASSGG
jgi:uncharacterized protein GlcG (DUF336 family)